MRCPFALQKLEQYKKTRGTFHLGKISGSTGLNANVRAVRPQIFRNKRTTFRLEQKFPFHFRE